MYKFVSENALIENIYLMLSVFREYQINPIFVFDGKPPDDKLELLKQRKTDKIAAEQEYELLKKNELTDSAHLNSLKKQFTYLTKKQIADVKTMIHAFNANYIEASGESDEVCAQMVLAGNAFAVMSEDMDMFVYGCPIVLRYTSLLNHTTVVYDLEGILATLGISQQELREICVLAGTDYTQSSSPLNEKMCNTRDNDLHIVLKLFKKYHKEAGQLGFCNWLRVTDRINQDEYNKVCDICQRFELQNVNYHIQANKLSDQAIVKKMLADEGFLFPIKSRMSPQKACL